MRRRDTAPPRRGTIARRDSVRAALTLLARACHSLELLAEIGELILGAVAHRPVVEAAIAPVADVEATHGIDPGGTTFGVRRLRHEQVDDVFPPRGDERADGGGI